VNETPDLHGAFPRLSEGHIATLGTYGTRRRTQEGDVLFREGDATCDFYVVLEGLVATVEGYGTPEAFEIGLHGPGRFLGELNLLTGQPVFVTAVVREPGEVLVVPTHRLREVVAEDPALGDVILRAYLIRRSLLIDLGAGFRIIGSRYSDDARRLRDFAARNRLPHRWIDVESDAEADAILRQLGVPPQDTPIVIWRDRVLRNPTNAELARTMGLPTTAPVDEGRATAYDLVIVGAGPAGLAAAVYAASEGLTTIAVDAVATGGQAGTSSRIENYLGFPAGLSGAELAERAVIQARKFGAQLSVPAAASGLHRGNDCYTVELDNGAELVGRALVVASGARYRRLELDRVEEFEPVSIYYAATEVEARVCAGTPVVVVGGGNAAGQATVFLSRRVAKVRLVARSDDLAKSMSRYLVDRIERTPGVEVLLNTEVCELIGDHALDAVVVENTATGQRSTLDAKALFVFIGAEANTAWLGGQLALDEHGFVATGTAANPIGTATQGASMLETSWPGVFAAGDIRSGSVKRVASAVGEGSMAVRYVHQHLSL
jgi:thioredoxin reductase (NADPH)